MIILTDLFIGSDATVYALHVKEHERERRKLSQPYFSLSNIDGNFKNGCLFMIKFSSKAWIEC